MKTILKIILRGEAKIIKGKVMKLFGKLIHDENLFLQGSYEEFYGKLQLRNSNV